MISPIPGDSHLLIFTAIVTICMQLAFFFVAAAFKFDKVTDFAGGTNFVVLAILTFVLGEVQSTRQVIVLAFVAIWGVRLSLFLLFRILKTGTDKRFDETRDSFFRFLAFWIYQMFWVWTVSLPVTFLQTTKADPDFGTASDIAGVIMFAVGLFVEAISDQQKFNFKNDPSNSGKWCNVGLWMMSRHPNYFGEILLWWGIFTMSSSVFESADNNGEGNWGYVTILGPAFVTGILLFASGIPILEKSADSRYGTREDYKEYKKSTSVLFLIPPGLYRSIPDFAKRTILFEWPMYNSIGISGDLRRSSGESRLLETDNRTP